MFSLIYSSIEDDMGCFQFTEQRYRMPIQYDYFVLPYFQSYNPGYLSTICGWHGSVDFHNQSGHYMACLPRGRTSRVSALELFPSFHLKRQSIKYN